MYNHKEIEKKWQDFWEKNNIFKTENDFLKPKWYSLDMFPYPSGAGLHVGHPEGFTANDIIARYKHAKGFNVLHPMGWDAFGLPAENYAIKTGTHPRTTTDKNIKTFKTQLKKLGFSYDWDREVDTTDANYYKWTQWIFLKLFEYGLAYEQDLPINYCPSCKTGLANEEVLNDFSCERCGTKVEKKKIKQWVLAITKYADRLLKDVDNLDWPESIKDMQRNWIGKSEGVEFEMRNDGDNSKFISVYTTRIDTVFGMTYAVLAPDHPQVLDFITEENKKECLGYIEKAKKKSDQDRTAENKEKTGVFTGSYVVNPFKNEKVPLWIADYVLGNYGTGAVMAVPAHDERDFEFAKKYGLEIKQSIAKDFQYTGVDAPRKGIETLNRKTIDVILENKKGEICLQVEKHLNGIHIHFVGGGIDYGDTELETVSKELIEETGYTDFEIVGPVNLSFSNSFGYRANKNKNQKCLGRAFHVKLKSDEQIKSEIDEGKHTIKWVKKEEVLNEITWSGHQDFWYLFYNGEKAFTEYGILVNSGEFNGLKSEKAKEKMTEFAEKQGFGTKKINYKLRDWLFSRQRYWGEPIPLIHITNEDFEKLPRIETISEIKDEKLAYISEKRPIYTIIENSLSKENIKKLNNFGELIVEKTTENRGRFFKLIVDFDKEEELIGFLKDKLITRLKENGGNWYCDSVGTSNKLIFNSKVFDIKSEKDLEEVMNYGLSVGVPKSELEISFKEESVGEYLIINGKTFSKVYDGLYSKIICDYNLPLRLPQVENYEPAGDGNSPLKNVESFVNIKLAENLSGKRETNTMPQWGGSCWYYLRFMDPKNPEKLVDPEIEKYWGQVDSYVGGAEHAVLHLLYARFWHKFLFDIGIVSHDEPFYRLRNQGLILAHAFERKNGGLLANDLVEEKDGKYYEISTGEEVNRIISKMSKSLKNVINPDDIIEEYGADSLRLYEMYMADFKDAAPWDTKGIIGVKRFLEKSERLFGAEAKISSEDDKFTIKLLHKTIKKVEEDIENYKFNTAIAALMILVNNGLPKDENLQRNWKETFVKLLHPFAPHLAEELFERIENGELRTEKKSIFFESWPEFDENLVKDDEITIGVQVMGKLRGEIKISVDEDEKSVLEKAKNCESVKKWIDGKNIIKEIYVKGKIVNLVVK